MFRFQFISIMFLAILMSCMPARQDEIQYAPVERGEGSYNPSANRNSQGELSRNEPMESSGKVRLNLPKASLASIELNTEILFYSLSYKDLNGTVLASRPKTKLIVDPSTQSGVVELSVPDKSSGIVVMTLDEDSPNGASFKGESKEISVDGPTKVSLTLKRVGEDADVSVDLDFGDEDEEPGTSQPGSGPDVSGIANQELAALVKSVGDPKKMSNPTYGQLKPVIDRFCGDCHFAGKNWGSTGSQDFFANRPVNNRLTTLTMPNPSSPYSKEMQLLKDAGFDYRQAMIDLAKSLGNNQ